METAIGVGSLVGGFALGLIAPRTRKGLMIIAAYTAFGLLAMALGVVDNVGLALVIMFAGGIANMAFVIPSQTLFQERTPPELMGRVVSFRFAMVFGGMSLAMAVGGLFVSVAGPGPVIAAGVLSVCAGLAGLLISGRPRRMSPAGPRAPAGSRPEPIRLTTGSRGFAMGSGGSRRRPDRYTVGRVR